MAENTAQTISELYLAGVASNESEAEVIEAYPSEIAYEIIEMAQHELDYFITFEKAIEIVEIVMDTLKSNA